MSDNERTDIRSGYAFILIFSILTMGILLIGYLHYLNYEQNFRAEMESELSSIAQLKVGELALWRKERFADGAILFKNATFSGLVRRFLEKPGDADEQRQLQDWIGQYTTIHEYALVYLVDAQGRIRISAQQAGKLVNLHEADDILPILRTGQVTFLDFHRHTPDDPIHLAVVVPILDVSDDNRPLGAIVMVVDPALYLYSYIGRWPTPSQTAETLLVRRDGDDVLFLSELRFRKNAPLNLRIPLTKTEVPAVRAALGQTGLMEGVDYRGEPVLVAALAVPGSPWYLLARINTSEVYAPVRERLWQMVAFIGVLLFGSGAAMGFVWRQKSARYRERDKAAAAILESETRFRQLAEASFEGIAISENGRFIDVNRTFLDMFGYEKVEEIVRRSALELTTPEYRDIVAAHIAAGYEKPYEIMGIRKDGSTIPIEVHGRMTEMAGRRVRITAVRDMTERKKATAALAESEQKFLRFFTMVPVPLGVVNNNGVIVYFNARFTEIFGYTRDDMPTIKEWWEQAYPDETYRQWVLETWGGAVAKAAKKGTAIESIEYKVTCKNGEERIVLIGGITIEDNLLATFIDITERKRAEEHLKTIEWLLKPKDFLKGTFIPVYGDVTKSNKNGAILNALGAETIRNIASEFMGMLETSSAVYEKNGDYAAGIFSSGWCQYLDGASFKLCNTDDVNQALSSGKWHCHESCWSEASKTAIQSGAPVDIECAGGIRLYALPIRIGDNIIGAINFGYGNPPQSHEKLAEIAEKFQVDVKELSKIANEYQARPQYIIDLAKHRLLDAANLIGLLVQRTQAEEALQKSAEEIKDLYNNAPCGYHSLDKDGFIYLINDTELSWLGYTRDEAIGKIKFPDLLMPASRQAFRENFPKLKKQGFIHDIEVEIIRKDGAVFTGLVNSTAIYDSSGNFVMSRSTIIDITERKQAEDAKQEALNRLQKIASRVPGVVYQIRLRPDGSFCFPYASDALRDLARVSPEEVREDASKAFAAVHPDDFAPTLASVQASARDLTPWQQEFRMKFEDGVERWVFGNALPEREADGATLWHGVITDITERKKAEREREQLMLKLSQKVTENEAILASQSNVVLSYDMNMNVQQVNPSFLRIYGFNPIGLNVKEIIRRVNCRMIDGSPLNLEEQPTPRALRGKETDSMLYQVTKAGGTLGFVETSSRPLLIEDRIVGSVTVWHDITELKIKEDELRVAKEEAEAATKLKDQFVSLVAHDLRSPFTSMMGLLRLFAERKPYFEDEESKKAFALVFNSGDRMLKMIEDLLKISRLQTGQITPNPRFFKGHMAAAVTIGSLSHLSSQKGIVIMNNVPLDTRLYADQSLFDEVLLNLLSNAIKFCSRGDKITFFIPPGLKSAIAIRDTGKGINEAAIPNLFKHEVKTTTSGTAGEMGTGLGLPYSYDIMKAHGGELTLESAPGEGSVFTAMLPYVKPVALVVDDEVAVRMLARVHLEKIGIDVIEAVNGDKALSSIKDRRPHIVITDINMPGMDGFMLLDRLKQDISTRDIPVIVITAMEAETRENAFRHGADDFVRKPIEAEDFIPRVRRFVG